MKGLYSGVVLRILAQVTQIPLPLNRQIETLNLGPTALHAWRKNFRAENLEGKLLKLGAAIARPAHRALIPVPLNHPSHGL